MEIINYFPGRIRVKIDSLYKNSELSQITRMYLRELDGINSVKVNPVLGTVALNFDSSKMNIKYIEDSLDFIIRNELHIKYIQTQYADYLNEENKFRKARNKMLIFGSIYVIYKIKQHYFGKFFINRNFPVLLAASMITLIKGYPQLKNAYQKVMKHFPSDSDKFILVAGTLLTLSREGNKGTMLLFLKAFTDALQSHSKLQIERMLINNNLNNNSFVWYNRADDEYLLPLKAIEENDIVSFYENEPIAVDGVVVEGSALINNIYYSGQPELKRINLGEFVCEGMIIVSGSLKVKVTRLSEKILKPDVVLNKLHIVQDVKKYQRSSIYYASAFAVGSYFITGSYLAPLSVLLLMTPSASNVALNYGLANYLKLLIKNKIMLRNINTIEKIRSVDSVVFDKTGTLTKGDLKIEAVEIFDEKYSVDKVIHIAASCEGSVYHPVSWSLRSFSEEIEPNIPAIYIPSKGVLSDYNGHKIAIGNMELMDEESIDISVCKEDNLKNESHITVYFAVDGKLTAKISMSEKIEEKSAEMVARLKEIGIKDISIISGDLESNAKKISRELNIAKYEGGMSVIEKQEFINNKKQDCTVIMAGDGINDSLAMKEADVSISFLNSASEGVLLKSDCILLEKDMLLIPKLIDITEQSYYRIQKNIDFSKNYNLAFGILAMFGYYGPFSAKSLNTLNSILAVLNSSKISTMPIKTINRNEVI